MSKIWGEYKNIKGGDFPKWWNSLTKKEKLEWREEKDKLDFKRHESRLY